MKHQKQLFAFVALAIVAVVLAKNNYLDAKPDFLKPCRRTDTDFISCFGKNIIGIFKEWKDGIPGLKSFGSLDPLYVKRISITQDDDNKVVTMNLDLLKIKLTGLSRLEIKVVSIDFEKATAEVKIRVPKLQIESDYKLKGRILNLPLDGNGKSTMIIDDFKADIQLHFKFRDEFGYTFADVDKLRMEIPNVGGFHLDLQNLFNGQKELEESTNIILNQNWRDLYTILGPTIRDAVQSIMSDRFKKVFAYVPAKYIIEDIPTAAELNG